MARTVAGLRVEAAQPFDLAFDFAPAARAALDGVRAGGDRLDDEEIGVAAARGDALERCVDGGVGVQDGPQTKSWTAGSAASLLIRSTRFCARRSAPSASTTMRCQATPKKVFISSP